MVRLLKSLDGPSTFDIRTKRDPKEDVVLQNEAVNVGQATECASHAYNVAHGDVSLSKIATRFFYFIRTAARPADA